VSEQLIIRLASQATQPIVWLVWSAVTQQVIASGELPEAAALPELAQRLGARPVTALVPAADVSLRQVSLPSKPTRQLLQAIPFMLEEELAEDIDQLVVALGPLHQDAEAQASYVQSVAVVRRDLMQQWLDQLQQAGFFVEKMLPDALCLPCDSEITAAAVQLGNDWLLRTGPWQACVVEASWWPMFLKLQALPTLHSYSPWPEEIAQPHQMAPAELPLVLLAQGLPQQSFNLLQGEFQPRRQVSAWRQKWQTPLVMAASTAILYMAVTGLEGWQTQQRAQQAKQQALQLYKQQFPGERVVNLNAQLKKKLASVGQVEQSFTDYLAQVQPLLAREKDMRLLNLRYDNSKRELKLQAEAADFQSFERVKTQLQQQGLQVEQGALNTINGKVQGDLTLRGQA
jgi:general secretion pathway protein L